jgi:predicted DNA-binding mobile mystery protein A
MRGMAEAMNCRFVYAVLPEQEVDELIKKRAIQKAKEQVKAASTHMALEAQALNDERLASEVERIASEIVEKMPADLWNDE